MLLLDVNVLVYAHRADLAAHPVAWAFLDDLVNGDAAFGVPELALSSMVRVVTQASFKPPSTTGQALDFCDAVRRSSKCAVLQPTENHWSIFERLCRGAGMGGKLVPDAYFAAFALDRGDEWVTADADYQRFPGLRWRNLLTGQSFTNPR